MQYQGKGEGRTETDENASLPAAGFLRLNIRRSLPSIREETGESDSQVQPTKWYILYPVSHEVRIMNTEMD